jgi:hypothetical protein
MSAYHPRTLFQEGFSGRMLELVTHRGAPSPWPGRRERRIGPWTLPEKRDVALVAMQTDTQVAPGGSRN